MKADEYFRDTFRAIWRPYVVQAFRGDTSEADLRRTLRRARRRYMHLRQIEEVVAGRRCRRRKV